MLDEPGGGGTIGTIPGQTLALGWTRPLAVGSRQLYAWGLGSTVDEGPDEGLGCLREDL